MRKGILVASIVVILCSLILGNMYLYYDHIETKNVVDVYLIIKKNDTLEQIAKQLQGKNIIESQETFIYYAKVKGLKESVEDRTYIIKPKTELNDLITKLKDGKSEFTVITIPEGNTLYQIASKLEKNNLVKKEDILNDKLNSSYLYKGLPPGPIASPGKASIEAALYPEKNDYLYYVARGNGKEHVFSKTYEEHLNNVEKYIK